MELRKNDEFCIGMREDRWRTQEADVICAGVQSYQSQHSHLKLEDAKDTEAKTWP